LPADCLPLMRAPCSRPALRWRDAGLRDVILRCLDPDPATRYQQAADVKAALDAIDSVASPSTAAAERLIAEVTKASYSDHHVQYGLGAAYAQLGDVPRAISWLDLAWSKGFPCYPWFVRDSMLDPIRDTPEFRQLMDRLRQSWELARAKRDAPR
jgi:hypothetical protein